MEPPSTVVAAPVRIESLRTHVQGLHDIVHGIHKKLEAGEGPADPNTLKAKHGVSVLVLLLQVMESPVAHTDGLNVLERLDQSVPIYEKEMKELEARIDRFQGASPIRRALLALASGSRAHAWEGFDEMVAHLTFMAQAISTQRIHIKTDEAAMASGYQPENALSSIKGGLHSRGSVSRPQLPSKAHLPGDPEAAKPVDNDEVPLDTFPDGFPPEGGTERSSDRGRDSLSDSPEPQSHDHSQGAGERDSQDEDQRPNLPGKYYALPPNVEAGKTWVQPCYIIILVMFVIIAGSAFLGIYYTVRYDKMGDGFTAASWIVAIGALVLAGPFAQHYPTCRCWRKDKPATSGV